MTKFKTIDEYIKSYPSDVQKILKKIRETIKQSAPKAEQVISYNIPTFKINGRPLVYFAAFKNHVSIYPVLTGKNAIPELVPYVTGKGTAQFQYDKPIPYTLIKKFVRYRMNL